MEQSLFIWFLKLLYFPLVAIGAFHLSDMLSLTFILYMICEMMTLKCIRRRL